ncbi:hypothetical protein DL98DRAFT_512907 [Cadophora sp. DSE1049]|nr:hypothetical protein DL98DRAFT_512907 [Cadophora sp. DSE1049]
MDSKMDNQGSESGSTPTPSNEISCQRCKLKKIRCNRKKPICGKCESLGVECNYLARRTGPRRNRRLEGMLQEIFQRLDRLEGLIVTNQAAPLPSFRAQLDTPMATPSLLTNHRLKFNPVLDLVNETCQLAREQLNASPHQSAHGELRTLFATLPQTVCELQEQLSTERHSWQRSSWSVPREKAQGWVNYWFDNVGVKSRVLHPQRDFIVSIPDLLRNPHVRIDIATQLAYYNLLFSGMMFHNDQDPEQGSYARQIFSHMLSIIPEWESEATGSEMDFLASFLTIWVALSFSEPDLAYKMLSYACRTGTALGLFQVDHPDNAPNQVEDESQEAAFDKDRTRMAFWFLLHYDCIFRLRYGRPPLIQPGTWTVKIPSVVDDLGNKMGFDPLHFIITTKITLVIMKFFEIFDNDDIPTDVAPRVCTLVEEISSIAVTWRLERNALTATDCVGRYLYVDQLLSSYINVILLCTYRSELLQIPELRDHVMKSARGSLGLLIQMTKVDLDSTCQTSMRSQWLIYSYLAIYRSILQSQDLPKRISDLESLVWLESMLDKWTDQHEEIIPLRAAINGLNKVAQASIEAKKASSSMSPPEMGPHPMQRDPLTPGQSLPPIHILDQSGFRFYSHPQP